MGGKTVLLILGASGDLAKRKLIPALNSIHSKKLLPEELIVVGSGRTEYTDESYREHVEVTDNFSCCLHYHVGLEGIKDYISSFGKIEKIVIFMSLPPSVYKETIQEIHSQGLVGNNISLIIEKPFGVDLESSNNLENHILSYYPKEQIYLIDHYLAKEPVQNILIFRFANSIFEPIWNKDNIESIEINCQETLGIEDRARYFDKSGIIRDMIQSHLLQLLTIITMDAPYHNTVQEITDRKLEVLKNLRVVSTSRGQYKGYREEKGVDPDSNIETFAEVEFRIDTYRWRDVPIFIKTGKATSRMGTEIGVKFKKVNTPIFENKEIKQNAIIFKVQPSSGIILDLVNKIPGWGTTLTNTNMSFCYSSSFTSNIPDAYQRLLVDAIHGDRSLFVGMKGTSEAWRVIEPALGSGELFYYNRGEDPVGEYNKDPIDFNKYSNLC